MYCKRCEHWEVWPDDPDRPDEKQCLAMPNDTCLASVELEKEREAGDISVPCEYCHKETDGIGIHPELGFPVCGECFKEVYLS